MLLLLNGLDIPKIGDKVVDNLCISVYKMWINTYNYLNFILGVIGDYRAPIVMSRKMANFEPIPRKYGAALFNFAKFYKFP